MSGGYHMMDPYSIETRFSMEDSLASLDSITEEVSEETRFELGKLKNILALLPNREADFLELYYFRKLKQTDIANVFKVSQPTVCYRLNRATTRVRFLLGLPKVDEDQMWQDLQAIFPDNLDCQILKAMYDTTCQSEAARSLGVSQGLVRHRFLRSIKTMAVLTRYKEMERQLRSEQAKLGNDRGGVAKRRALDRVMAKNKDLMDRIPEEVRNRPDFYDSVKQYHSLYDYIGTNLSILREISKPIEDPKIYLID